MKISQKISKLSDMIDGINKTANHFIACLVSQKFKLYALHDYFTKYPNGLSIFEHKEIAPKFQSLLNFNSDLENSKPINIHFMQHIISYEHLLFESESLLEDVKQV